MDKYLLKLRNKVKELNEAIKAKRAEGEVDNVTLEALKKVNEELRKLCDERDAVQEMIDEIMEAIAESGNTDPKPMEGGEIDPKPMEGGRSAEPTGKNSQHTMERKTTIFDGKQKNGANERMIKLGDDLKAKRTVTVSSSSLIVPTKYKDNIEGTFQQYSSLVDNVKQVNLNGGESYKAPYEIGVADATAGTEGTAAAGGQETTFGYVDIPKAKIVAYAELSEEVKKLPSANYAEMVVNGVTTSIKKKIAKDIMTGAGGANAFTGIFSTNEANKCVLTSDDVELTAIDENTLSTLVGAVGGEEAIEGNICLILSKKDVLAFAQLRDLATGAKLHEVDFVRQTIDGIPYFINSACKSVATAGVGEYCMACGILSSFEEAIFSDLEIQESMDYKFKEGIISYRGVVFAGGAVTKYRGFVRAKKASA